MSKKTATLSELYRQAQSIMSFTRGRTRWKQSKFPPPPQFAPLNQVTTFVVCTWIISILTSTEVMAVKNQDSKSFTFDLNTYFKTH